MMTIGFLMFSFLVPLLTDRAVPLATTISSVCHSMKENAKTLSFNLVLPEKTKETQSIWDVESKVRSQCAGASFSIQSITDIENQLTEAKVTPVWDWVPAAAKGDEVHPYSINVPDWDNSPKHNSPFNHLRFYMAKLSPFNQFDRVIFLDDDVIIQDEHAIRNLWDMSLADGKVMSAGCFNWLRSPLTKQTLYTTDFSYLDVPFLGFGTLTGKSVKDATCSAKGQKECVPEGFMEFLSVQSASIDKSLNIPHSQDMSESYLRSQSAWNFGLNLIDLKRWRESQQTEKYELWMSANHDNHIYPTTSLAYGLGIPYLSLAGSVQCSDDKVTFLQGMGIVSDVDLVNAGISPVDLKNYMALHYNGDHKPWDVKNDKQARRMGTSLQLYREQMKKLDDDHDDKVKPSREPTLTPTRYPHVKATRQPHVKATRRPHFKTTRPPRQKRPSVSPLSAPQIPSPDGPCAYCPSPYETTQCEGCQYCPGGELCPQCDKLTKVPSFKPVIQPQIPSPDGPCAYCPAPYETTQCEGCQYCPGGELCPQCEQFTTKVPSFDTSKPIMSPTQSPNKKECICPKPEHSVLFGNWANGRYGPDEHILSRDGDEDCEDKCKKHYCTITGPGCECTESHGWNHNWWDSYPAARDEKSHCPDHQKCQCRAPISQPSQRPPHSKPHSEPQAAPYGFEPNAEPYGFEPNTEPYGFEPNAEPYGFEPNTEPYGFEPNTEPYGFGRE